MQPHRSSNSTFILSFWTSSCTVVMIFLWHSLFRDRQRGGNNTSNMRVDGDDWNCDLGKRSEPFSTSCLAVFKHPYSDDTHLRIWLTSLISAHTKFHDGIVHICGHHREKGPHCAIVPHTHTHTHTGPDAHRACWAAQPGTPCGTSPRRGAEPDSGWSWSSGRCSLLSGSCQAGRCCSCSALWRCSWWMFPAWSWLKPLQRGETWWMDFKFGC